MMCGLLCVGCRLCIVVCVYIRMEVIEKFCRACVVVSMEVVIVRVLVSVVMVQYVSLISSIWWWLK